MTNLTTINSVSFNLPTITSNPINAAAVAKVNEYLPEIEQQTRAFDRNNSQHTLSLMSLTMLNGHSPMRMMRQVMAEVEKRKMALAEAQHSHAERREEIQELEDKGLRTEVEDAKLRMLYVQLSNLESKINGSFKDIATLIDAYNNIKAKNGIDEWDEEAFEREEKRHHVRRGFELMYRNLMDGGRASTATIEYMQQYGVHPQVGLAEVAGYVQHTSKQIANGVLLHSNDLEDFLDTMADKYCPNVDKTAERLFGKSDFVNPDYMMRLEKPKEDNVNDL